MTKRVTPAAATSSAAPPCPLCDSTRGRTQVSEARTSTDSKTHQTTARSRRFRCFACGRTYTEESDRN
jgi:transposase-like protein